jgi:hypothetical protein
MINKMIGQIKLNHTYSCFYCKKEQIGDSFTAEFIAYSVDELTNLLYRVEPSPKHMPVYWASFYNKTGTRYSCDSCTK